MKFCRQAPFFDDQGIPYLFVADTLWRFEVDLARFAPYLVLPQGFECIHTYLFARDGRLWLSSWDRQILRIDLETMQVQAISMRGSREAMDALGHLSIHFEDRRHNIWFSTDGFGFMKISARAELFKRQPPSMPKYDQRHYLGRVLLPSGKAVYDAKIRAQWLKRMPLMVLPESGAFVLAFNLPLTMDADGKFWFLGLKQMPEPGNDRLYVLRMDTVAGQLAVVEKLQVSIDGSRSGFFFPDKDHQVWDVTKTVTPPQVYFQADHIRTGAKRRIPIPGLHNWPANFEVMDWCQTPAGTIWMACNLGLYRCNPQTGEVAEFHPIPGNPYSLTENNVFCVEADPHAPERILWVGTRGGGLNCLDQQSGKFYAVRTTDGLPNDVVYAILFDRHHNLWLSTNNGICLFDPLKMTFRNFTKADGLVGNEFNHYEYGMASNGEIYFGGFSGVSHFNPEDFYRKGEPSEIVINSLKLDNKLLEFKQGSHSAYEGFHLEAPMEATRELVFPHNHQMIGIGFALLDLTVPDRNQFRYRLRGFSDVWIEAGSAHEAIYTNLNPGTYTFEVMGCNSSNAWTTAPATLSIVITPPWWGTWWFRVMVILMVSGLLYALYNYRLQQLLKVERLRNRIGQDLHDEIGSTLSSISLYSAVMQKTSDSLPPRTVGILDKIISSTSQMMESMNDMVWTIKASNDSFDNVVNRMRAFAVNMTEAQEIEMTFMVDPQVEKLSLGMEQRKNVYLIYKEAVNNAAKYARCTTLNIALKKVPGALELTISDNGVGFDLEDKAARTHLLGGNGLAGMQARAKAMSATLEIDSAPGKGTVVRLRLPL